MSKPYYVIEKKEAETPLQALDRLRILKPELHQEALAYAGRLDPMASGKLLVLAGEECKKQKDYHALDKEYEFEMLCGFSSDTGDILGIPNQGAALPLSLEVVRTATAQIPNNLSLTYPIFSSKTVRGKPLFLWALENKLGEIEIPVAHTKLYGLRTLSVRTLTGKEMLKDIKKRIGVLPQVEEESKKLGADFRRKEILEKWSLFLEEHSSTCYTIAKYRCTVSSGTYIRSLAPALAEVLGTTGLAYSIHRTTIGRYLPIVRNHGFWTRKYT